MGGRPGKNEWMVPPGTARRAARRRRLPRAQSGGGDRALPRSRRRSPTASRRSRSGGCRPRNCSTGARPFSRPRTRPNLGPLERADADAEPGGSRARDRRADAELAAAEAPARTRRFEPILGVPLWQLLPPTLVTTGRSSSWSCTRPTSLLLLLIGKVPLAYNFRYLWVRKRDTLLTALAFTVVVALVVVLLAFVNGMYKLNESTGVPGNVLVHVRRARRTNCSATWRAADADNVEQRRRCRSDQQGRPIGPVGCCSRRDRAGRPRHAAAGRRAEGLCPARSTWRASSRTS